MTASYKLFETLSRLHATGLLLLLENLFYPIDAYLPNIMFVLNDSVGFYDVNKQSGFLSEKMVKIGQKNITRFDTICTI